MASRIKQARKQKAPSSIKKPRIDQEPNYNQPIGWRLGGIDKGGSWGWGEIDAGSLWEQIHPKLIAFESMTVQEIMLGGRSHDVSISDISKEAQKRLEEIKQQDIDKIFSLRLSGQQRIWGILDKNFLKILWWDPNHTVCPSNLKNT